jgi:hypothetical protein
MKLRPNDFGVFVNAGLALFIAVVLISRGFYFFSSIFFGIAVYHLIHRKRVEVSQNEILIRYPLAILTKRKLIPSSTLVSYRFTRGHYTELGAVFVKYRDGKSIASIKIPVDPADSRQLESLFHTWLPPR